MMKVAETREELRKVLKEVPEQSIMFVPTMGALHEGHMSLIRAARGQYPPGDGFSSEGRSGKASENFVREHTDAYVTEGNSKLNAASPTLSRKTVVVSVFVNPTQFNDPNDLKNYPRTPGKDLAMLEAEGVDVVFMPSVEEIYPEPDTRVWDFGSLDKIMEGATRPGHFNGVAQVVSRLFELVRPAKAFFGQKDFQQVAIIREMVRQAHKQGETWADVEIVECPTVREDDGLAMSSRNALLTPQHRAAAPDIYRALRLGSLKAGEFSPRELERYVVEETERSGLLKVIYFGMMDHHACIAVQAGGVRLIDNMRYDN